MSCSRHDPCESNTKAHTITCCRVAINNTLFLFDKDRHTFLSTLERMSERCEVDIITFVLMDNHYHLLLRTKRLNLSKSMQWLGATYTTIFNLSYSQKGHLFQ
jgi:REP element-mobilizing transposase RayT